MNNLRGEFTFDINGKKYEASSPSTLCASCVAHKIKLEELDMFMKEDDPCHLRPDLLGHQERRNAEGKESKLMGFDQFCALVLDDGETFESLAQAVTSALDAPEGNE